MDELKCLFLEHDENEHDDLLEHLRAAWDDTKPVVPIRLIPALTPKQARDLLDDSFHLIVADLIFPSTAGDRTEGVHFIQLARKKHADIAIIALSGATGDEPKKAIDAGADAFISKQEVFGTAHSVKEAGETMKRVLMARGHKELFVPSVVLSFNPKDWRTAATVENIGRDRIITLLSSLMTARNTPLEKVDVHHIGSGWSGAFVIGARCHTLIRIPNQTTPTKQVMPIVLKVSRDQAALKKEVLVTEQFASVVPGRVVRFPFTDVPEDEGWFGIASSEVADSKTLYESLRQGHLNAEYDAILARLFTNSPLREIYNAYTENADRADAAILMDLLHPRRFRVRAAYESLRCVVDRHMDDRDRALLLTVLEGTDLSELKAPALRTRRCLSHADLHLRNIMVDSNGAPWLIDAVNARELHWAADIARLTADVIISAWDADEREHEWGSFDDWRGLVRAVVSDELSTIVVPPDDENYGPLRALKWLVANIGRIHAAAGVAAWEFHLALAAEFLRASYRDADTPSPKRALGVVAGVDIVRVLTDSIWSQR